MSPVSRAVFCLLLAFIACDPARGADRIGVVLLHGKQGHPGGYIAGLVAAVQAAGYLVEAPEMCWSRNRIYDRPYLGCLSDLDAAVTRLKTRGATAIVVGGQSLGANAAIRYAATRSGLKGVISLAAGHLPERMINRPAVAESMATARAMIAQGKGKGTATFADVNEGPISVSTTPEIYLSFVGPSSLAVIPANAARLKAPLLWVEGNADRLQLGRSYAFSHAPPNRLNRYVMVSADHLGTPNAARDAVLAWLKDLSGN